MKALLVGLCIVALTSAPALAAENDQVDFDDGIGVERVGEDVAGLEARDADPAEPGGDGADVCGPWQRVSLLQVPGVPDGLRRGLDADDADVVRTRADGVVEALFFRLCDNWGGFAQYSWLPLVPELEALLIEARELLFLPAPAPGFSPPGVGAGTVVGLDTWFWIPEADWVPLAEDATAGAVTVTATATPVLVRFVPGDGEAPVVCAGPGRPWERGAATECRYTYRYVSAHHGSGVWPGQIEVEWEVTWTSNVGQSGVLEPFVLVTPTPMTVFEAQAIIRPPGG